MIEKPSVINLEVQGQDKAVKNLGKIAESFEGLTKQTKTSTEQFEKIQEVAEKSPKSFNLLTEANNKLKDSYHGTNKALLGFKSQSKSANNSLANISKVTEATDNGFLRLGTRLGGVNKEFSGFHNALTSVADPYDSIMEGNTALSKGFRAINVLGNPVKNMLFGFSDALNSSVEQLHAMGPGGEVAAGALSKLSGGLESAAGKISLLQGVGKVFLFGEKIKEVFESIPELIEDLQEVYEKAEQFGVINALFGTTEKKVTTAAKAFLFLEGSATKVLGVFGKEKSSGLIKAAATGWLKLMAYKELYGVFSALSQGIYDATLKLQGLSTGFATLQGMGIDTQFAEMATQLGTMGLSLVTNGKAAEDFAQKAIAAFAQLEDQIRSVMVLADASAIGQQKLAENLRSVASALGNVATTSELAQAQYTAISAGFKDANFLQDVTKFSKAMSVDMTQSTETAARMLRIFKLEARDTSKVLSQAKVVLDKGILTGSDYASVMGELAGVAKSAGLSLEQTNVMLQRLTTQGLSANEASQGLMSLLGAIAGQGAQSADAVKALGINFNELRIRTDGLVAPLNELYSATGGSLSRMKEIIPDALALRTALSLARLDTDEFNASVIEMGNVGSEALDDVFNERNQSLIAKSSALMNGFQEEIVSLGERLVPLMDRPLAFLEKLLSALQELPDPVKNVIAGAIGLSIVTERTTKAFEGLTGVLFKLGKAYLTSRVIYLALNGLLLDKLKTIGDLVLKQGKYVDALKEVIGWKQKEAVATEAETVATAKNTTAETVNTAATKANTAATYEATAADQAEAITVEATTVKTNQDTAATAANTAATQAAGKAKRDYTNLLLNFLGVQSSATTESRKFLGIFSMAENTFVGPLKGINKMLTASRSWSALLPNLALGLDAQATATGFAAIASKAYTVGIGLATAATKVLKAAVLQLWATLGPVAVVVGALTAAFLTLQDIAGTFIPALGGVSAENKKLADAIQETLIPIKQQQEGFEGATEGAEYYSGFLNTKLLPTFEFLFKKAAQLTPALRLIESGLKAVSGGKIDLAVESKIDQFFTGIKDNIQAYIEAPLDEAIFQATQVLQEEFDRTLRVRSIVKTGKMYSGVAKEIMEANHGRALSAKELNKVLKSEEEAVQLQIKNNEELTSSLREQLEEIKNPEKKKAFETQIKLIEDQTSALQEDIKVQQLFVQEQNAIKEAIEANNVALSQQNFLQGVGNQIGVLEKAFDGLEEIVKNVPDASKSAYLEMESSFEEQLNLTSATQRRTGQRLVNIMADVYANLGQVAKDGNRQNLTEMNDEAQKAIEAVKDSVAQGVIDQGFASELINQILDQEVEIDGVKGSPLRAALVQEAQNALIEIERSGLSRRVAVMEEEVAVYRSMEATKIMSSELVAQKVNQIERTVLQERLTIEKEILATVEQQSGKGTEAYEQQARVVKQLNQELQQNAVQGLDAQLAIATSAIDRTIKLNSAKAQAALITQQDMAAQNAEKEVEILKLRYKRELEIAEATKERLGESSAAYKTQMEEVAILATEIQAKTLSAMQAAHEKLLIDLKDSNSLAAAEFEEAVLRGQSSRNDLIEKQAEMAIAESEQRLENINKEIAAIQAKGGETVALEAQAAQLRVSIEQGRIDKVVRFIDREIAAINNRNKTAELALQKEISAIDIQSEKLKLQTEIIEARNSAISAAEGIAEKQIQDAAAVASSEVVSARLGVQAAQLRVQSLERSQKIAQQNLEIEQRQMKMSLQREEVQMRINRLEQQSAVIAAQAELRKAKAQKASAEELQALELNVQSATQQLALMGEQEALFAQRKAQSQEILEINQQNLNLSQAQERIEAQVAEQVEKAMLASTEQIHLAERQLKQKQLVYDLDNAIAGAVKSQYEILSSLSSDTVVNAKIAAKSAELELGLAEKRASIEVEALAVDQQRKLAALEQEKIKTRLTIAANQQLSAELEIARVQAQNRGDEKSVAAIAAQIEGLEKTEAILLDQLEGLDRKAEFEEKSAAVARVELMLKQATEKAQLKINQAVSEVAAITAEKLRDLEYEQTLLEAQQKIYTAIDGLIQGQVSAIGSISSSQAIQARAAEQNALIQQAALSRQFEIQQKSLALEQEKILLGLEEEKLKTQVAIAANQALKAELKIAMVREAGNAAMQQALSAQLEAIEEQDALLAEQVSALEKKESVTQSTLNAQQIELKLNQLSQQAQAEMEATTASINAQMEQRLEGMNRAQQLMEAEADLREAQLSQYEGILNIVSKLTQEESSAAYLRRVSAEKQLEALEDRQKIESQTLEMDIQRKELELEREKIQTRMAIAANQQAVAMARMEAVRARASGDEKSAQAIEQAAASMAEQTQLLQEQQSYLGEQERHLNQMSQMQRAALSTRQEQARAEAQIEAELARQEQAHQRNIAKLEAQQQLAESAQNRYSTQVNVMTGALEVASGLARSDFDRRKIAIAIAKIKLESLEVQQEMEMNVLKLQQEQKKAMLEQEQIRVRVQQSQNMADIAATQAEIAEKGPSKALMMKLDAQMKQGAALEMAASGLGRQQQIMEELMAFELANLEDQQQLQELQARAALAETKGPRGYSEKRRIQRDALEMATGSRTMNGVNRAANRRRGSRSGLTPDAPELNMNLDTLTEDQAMAALRAKLQGQGLNIPGASATATAAQEVTVKQTPEETAYRGNIEAIASTLKALETNLKGGVTLQQRNEITNNIEATKNPEGQMEQLMNFTNDLFNRTQSLLKT